MPQIPGVSDFDLDPSPVPPASGAPAPLDPSRPRRMPRSKRVRRVGVTVSVTLLTLELLEELREKLELRFSSRAGLGRAVELMMAWFEQNPPEQSWIDEAFRGG